MPPSNGFTITNTDHITTILRGDDVVGHVVPMYSGFAPLVFHEATGVFEALSLENSLPKACLRVEDEWWKEHGRSG